MFKKQGNKISDHELWSHSWEQKNYSWLCHAGLHMEVLLKLKGQVCALQTKPVTQLPVLLQPGPCAQLASLHLGRTQLPSAEPLGCRGFTEPWHCLWAITRVSSCGSCPALNTGTAAELTAAPLSSLPQQFTSCLSPAEWSEPLQPDDVH